MSLSPIIEKATELNLADRYFSARAMLEDLSTIPADALEPGANRDDEELSHPAEPEAVDTANTSLPKLIVATADPSVGATISLDQVRLIVMAESDDPAQEDVPSQEQESSEDP